MAVEGWREHYVDGPMPRGHVRLYRGEGSLVTADDLSIQCCRHTGMVLIALDGGPLDVELADGARHRHGMLALRPHVEMRIHARSRNVGWVDVVPSHPLYRTFHQIGGDGCLPLPHERYEPLTDMLAQFHRQPTSGTEAYRLFRRAVNIVASHLPELPPLDGRVARALRLLHEDPILPLDQVAAAVALSADRLSRLFRQQMGLSVRQFAQAAKLIRAVRYFGSGRSLTEIAAAAHFTDLAHFSKVWARCYGLPPAYFFLSGHLRERPPAPPEGLAPRARPVLPLPAEVKP